MKLIDALSLRFPSVISVVGAGGKTSFIYTLAREAAAQGKSVLVTTTTAMFNPEYKKTPVCDPDRLCLTPAADLAQSPVIAGTITLAAQGLRAGGQKLDGYSPEALSPLLTAPGFDLVLIEADGAKMRPLKAPADHEPVIASQTDMVAGVIGLDCLGTPLAAPYVHRPEHLVKLTGQKAGTPVTPDTLVRLAESNQGLFKSTGPDMKKIIILNKADTPDMLQKGDAAGKKIIKGSPASLCLVTSFNNQETPVLRNISNLYRQSFI